MEIKNFEKILTTLKQELTLDGIKTADLIKEMQTAYDTINKYEKIIEDNKNTYEEKSRKIKELELQMQSLKNKMIDQDELEKKQSEFNIDKKKLDDDKFKFEIESKYIARENSQLREIIRSMLAIKTTNRNETGANGTYIHSNEYTDKPNI